MRGFYERMSNGPGRFITREEIEARRVGRVIDLLRSMPNLRPSAGRMGTSGPMMARGSSASHCQVMFFIDGIRMIHPMPTAPRSRAPDFLIDDYVSPGEIEGIEVYRGEADTPSEFVTPLVGCGTVVIWTRRGRR
jgi:outer membrane receptor for ferrienterochelin and colicin